MPSVTTSDVRAIAESAVLQIDNIATLPEITARIMAIVEDPNSSAAELHRVVSHDPALVARILKVVNSAFYGLPGQIASIERAIVLLGLTAVKNLAVAASLGQLFRGLRLGAGYTAKELWKHCIAVGVAARDLAAQMRVPLQDEAFLAGMIHDVGFIVAIQVWPDKVASICEEAAAGQQHFCDIERDTLGVDHQILGAALCEKWKFPRSCQLAASHHHRPTELADNNRLLTTLVYIADTLCCEAREGFDLTARHQTVEASEPSAVGLDVSCVEHTRRRLPELVKTVALLQ